MKKLGIGFLLAALLMGTLLVAVGGRVLAEPYDRTDGLPAGPFVARVYYNRIEDIERLATYDVWEYNNLKERYVLVGMDATIYEKLVKEGWRLQYDAEATAKLFPTAAGIETFYGAYRTVDEIYADMDATNAAHPELTEISDYGDSYCKSVGGCVTLGGDPQAGYDLRAIRVTNEAITGDKPVFFLMANIHAREITTPELAMRMLDWLIDGYGTDPNATWIVDYHEVWIVPVANPDGHWLVELGTRPPYNGDPFYQRKSANRSNGCNTWPPNDFSQYGIDLNRNHSFEWNTGGSSNAPCDQTYRGPFAASELEVSELQDLVLSLIPDQRGPGPNDPAPADTTGLLITMHSYSELVLWPWGNKTTAAPNKVGLKAIGDKFATYNGYTSCQPSICLYITSGTTDDWGYGVLGIPSFTFEVGQQFMPSYSEIDSAQWPLNGPALQYAAKIVRTPYMLVNGPDALSVAVSDNGNDTYDLTATINDSSNGGQTVSQALYYVDTPPWDGGTGLPMAASDGSFNSAVENVDATINGSGLAAGRHTIFVQGTDSQGNAGPVGAAFLFVLEPGVSPTIRGYVREAGTNAPLSATVKAGSLFQTSTNPTTGYYEFQVVAGTYDLSAEADGHATVTLSGVTVNNYQTLDQDFSLSRVCDAFSEDVEAGQNGWLRQRPWAITTESSHSPTHSWTDSPGGNYRNNRNVGIGSPIINLTGYTDVTLNFWQICDTEAGYDYCRVEVSNNGGATWTEVATYDGPSSQWEEVSVDVSDLLDNQANVRLRFRLTTDVAIVDDGWHLDNIRLTGASDACY